MVGKIDLIDEQNHHSYVLKIYTNNSDQPTFLFHCSYIDRPKKDALTEAKQAKKDFSEVHNIPLEEDLES